MHRHIGWVNSASSSSFAAPPLSLLAMEPLRALLDHLAARVGSAPLPIGDGHPVVVYPGLGAGEITTAHLRRYLDKSGFAAHDWEGGVNTGPAGDPDEWLAGFEEKVQDLHRLHERKVSLIGWSLGGIYAREIAKRRPAFGAAGGHLGHALHRAAATATTPAPSTTAKRIRRQSPRSRHGCAPRRRCPPPRSTARATASCPGAAASRNRPSARKTSKCRPATWAS